MGGDDGGGGRRDSAEKEKRRSNSREPILTARNETKRNETRNCEVGKQRKKQRKTKQNKTKQNKKEYGMKAIGTAFRAWGKSLDQLGVSLQAMLRDETRKFLPSCVATATITTTMPSSVLHPEWAPLIFKLAAFARLTDIH